jgi:hypothetical protein
MNPASFNHAMEMLEEILGAKQEYLHNTPFMFERTAAIAEILSDYLETEE